MPVIAAQRLNIAGVGKTKIKSWWSASIWNTSQITGTVKLYFPLQNADIVFQIGRIEEKLFFVLMA